MSEFNLLSEAEIERLAILAEECGEVVQAVAKILRHGYGSSNPTLRDTNRISLEKELGDVVFAIRFMQKSGDIDRAEIDEHADAKARSIKWWLHHQ